MAPSVLSCSCSLPTPALAIPPRVHNRPNQQRLRDPRKSGGVPRAGAEALLSLASAAALYHEAASSTFYCKIYKVGRPTPIKLNQLMKKGVNFAKEWTDEHTAT